MKKLYLVLILILSIGFVAAHGIYANMNGGVDSSPYGEQEYDINFDKKDFIKWDNTDEWVKRGPSGWEKESWDEKNYYKYDRKEKWDKWDEKKWKHEYSGKKYYYDYVPHMRDYVKKSCYDSAPAGQLFYIKC